MEYTYLFPTIIASEKIRKFTEKEINVFNQSRLTSEGNVSNLTSNNKYILDTEGLEDLKKIITMYCEKYYFDILKTKTAKPYITQSWLNWTGFKKFHHTHWHSNSIISGVLYIDVEENVDSITFNSRNPKSMFRFNTFEESETNSRKAQKTVCNNELLLFPSDLEHEVAVRENDPKGERISLSFNTFVKGKVGDAEGLTELIL